MQQRPKVPIFLCSCFLVGTRLFVFYTFGQSSERIFDSTTDFCPESFIQPLTQLSILVHLTPTVSAPFTPSHIDYEIAIVGAVMDLLTEPLVAARAWWETVDLALGDKGDVGAYPGLVLV